MIQFLLLPHSLPNQHNLSNLFSQLKTKIQFIAHKVNIVCRHNFIKIRVQQKSQFYEKAKEVSHQAKAHASLQIQTLHSPRGLVKSLNTIKTLM